MNAMRAIHRSNLRQAIRELETLNPQNRKPKLQHVMDGFDGVAYVLSASDSEQDKKLAYDSKSGPGSAAVQRAGEMIGLAPEDAAVLFDSETLHITKHEDLLGAFWHLMNTMDGGEAPLSRKDVDEALAQAGAKGQRIHSLNLAISSFEESGEQADFTGLGVESGYDAVPSVLLHCGDSFDGMDAVNFDDDEYGGAEGRAIERAGEILGISPEASQILFAEEDSPIRDEKDLVKALKILKQAAIHAEDCAQPLPDQAVREALAHVEKTREPAQAHALAERQNRGRFVGFGPSDFE